uniref:PD40 domain-containing protein n=1 Tax=Phenylobacterium glaciei TaxID=2803784 RepID=A0A974P0E6_9CAUL|nr:PD40 domain-containing protein [Phenylobacterium glaciei]
MPDWESNPAWSPDGKSIAYLQGGPPKLIGYGVRHLAVVSADGGRHVWSPAAWTAMSQARSGPPMAVASAC